MKARHIGIMLMAILTLFGCDDTTNTLGLGMLPDSDGMSAHTATFDVTTRSIAVDSVFAKTSIGYVGKFSDPEFGYYETSFLTELNCVDNFAFPEVYTPTEWDKDGNPTKATGTMAGDSIVSVQLIVYYENWFGDSLNACRMSVYELDKKLDKNRYTNINPEEFYNKYDDKLLLGRKAYSAYDTTVPDSVRNETNSSGNKTYSPNVTFLLDKKEFGEERLLKVYRQHPEYFKNAASFIDKVFKGVYVKSDYGDGTILYVDQVGLLVQLRFHYVDEETGVALKKKDGTDSLYYSYYNSEKNIPLMFASTKEVIQANQFLNSQLIKEKVNESEHTYIKSPAGIFTEATIPYDEIYNQLSQDTLNAVKLTFTNYNITSNYEYSMSAPTNVLLLRKKELKSFFEGNKVSDNITSFTTTHNAFATNQYTFSNIARLVTTCINEKQTAKQTAKEEAGDSWNETQWEEKWEKANEDWDKVLLIPVSITYDSNTSSSSSTMTGIQNDLKPGYAKLRGGSESPLKIEVTYTSFGK
ncbi:DUF4270 domain-containing protein [Bacteroides sp.]|uniref:DUF4270 domain-containing protein n=1 Tax=Bacteroides sp. TaxID=29523 RepID=UPI0023D07E26|nr:DUF4270 domain-containing protein [Bacteroides sp.]MDE5710017.1 DUF4270 domain-containing protein [Bacteroides sp.]MDE6215030.1 DUF4270 domain-containing protein [Bacteroides sp.]